MRASSLGRSALLLMLSSSLWALAQTPPAAPAPAAKASAPPALIPRDTLFGNPERAKPDLSPDGKRLAWLAPDKKDVLQVWVKTVGKDDDAVVTADKKRGIRQYFWAEDSNTVLYLQDSDGDENYHVYAVDLTAKSVRDLTPFQGIRASLVATSYKLPGRILVNMNLRNRQLFDVYRVELKTGALELDTTNPGDVADWAATDDLFVKGAQASLPDGSTELRVRDSAKSPWHVLLAAPATENLQLMDFSKDGSSAYLISSLGQDTARVVQRSVKTGAEKVVAQSAASDATDVAIHPVNHVVQAVAFDPGMPFWMVVDESVRPDFDALAKASAGAFKIVSRDRADKTWLVAYTLDQGGVRYYRWDRATKTAQFMFSAQPKLDSAPLVTMTAVEFPARDGLKLRGYLSRPLNASGPGPLVLFVHGGPWSRDFWGYNPYPQWLANRGYSVLQVNYRGSTGFGKAFLHAGDKQWGKKMHTDLIDAVDWAVKTGVADPKQLAIMGGSYGGYAALAGATFTPDVFRASVDIVGPSNLLTLLATIPPYWKTAKSTFNVRLGNPDDPKDAAYLHEVSPLFSVDKIRIPILIGQGANDPRVKVAESEQIVAAMEKKGLAVTYVLYPDEGHGFARPENRIDFNARAELFLQKYLGGRAEPLPGDKIPGSTAVVKVVEAKPAPQAAR
ncbi:MAG: S9 family peptidase [Myxococcaceae bacterium]